MGINEPAVSEFIKLVNAMRHELNGMCAALVAAKYDQDEDEAARSAVRLANEQAKHLYAVKGNRQDSAPLTWGDLCLLTSHFLRQCADFVDNYAPPEKVET